MQISDAPILILLAECGPGQRLQTSHLKRAKLRFTKLFTTIKEESWQKKLCNTNKRIAENMAHVTLQQR